MTRWIPLISWIAAIIFCVCACMLLVSVGVDYGRRAEVRSRWPIYCTGGARPIENIHDARDRGRMRQALTPDIVRHLRAVRESGASMRKEAARLGINYQTAMGAATGVNWSYIK